MMTQMLPAEDGLWSVLGAGAVTQGDCLANVSVRWDMVLPF